MKIQYSRKVSNGATFRFSAADEAAVIAALKKETRLSLGPTNAVTQTVFGVRSTFHEVTGTAKSNANIDEILKALGATPIEDPKKDTKKDKKSA